jgi:hypothetical protein
MATATVTRTKTTEKPKRKTVSKEQPAKKKISKLGQMRGSYKGKIIEHGSNIWNL